MGAANTFAFQSQNYPVISFYWGLRLGQPIGSRRGGPNGPNGSTTGPEYVFPGQSSAPCGLTQLFHLAWETDAASLCGT